jgi:hypothetical protein
VEEDRRGGGPSADEGWREGWRREGSARWRPWRGGWPEGIGGRGKEERLRKRAGGEDDPEGSGEAAGREELSSI